MRTIEPPGEEAEGVASGEGGVSGNGRYIECNIDKSVGKMMTVERDWETKAFVMYL